MVTSAMVTTAWSKRRQRRREQQGFTLIETMFALSIFAIAALAAVFVATEQLRSTAVLEERYLGQLVASNRLAEVYANTVAGVWPPQNELEGTVELANREWHWQQQVVETVTDDLREVTIRVRRTENGPVLLELSSFMGRR